MEVAEAVKEDYVNGSHGRSLLLELGERVESDETSQTESRGLIEVRGCNLGPPEDVNGSKVVGKAIEKPEVLFGEWGQQRIGSSQVFINPVGCIFILQMENPQDNCLDVVNIKLCCLFVTEGRGSSHRTSPACLARKETWIACGEHNKFLPKSYANEFHSQTG